MTETSKDSSTSSQHPPAMAVGRFLQKASGGPKRHPVTAVAMRAVAQGLMNPCELAIEVCSRSGEHSAGRGRHDAHRWGPCSDHERIVNETLFALTYDDTFAAETAASA